MAKRKKITLNQAKVYEEYLKNLKEEKSNDKME